VCLHIHNNNKQTNKQNNNKTTKQTGGLNYLQKDKFRSSVLIDYGKPIYLDTTISDPKEQVRDL
jgi:hypothetical protein